MKTLNDYTKDPTTALFKQYGAFFAFTKEQFNEKKDPALQDSDYVTSRFGLIVPAKHQKEVMEGLAKVHADGIQADLAENGLENIIRREINNYEAMYTNDLSDVTSMMIHYGASVDQVKAVFKQMRIEEAEADALEEANADLRSQPKL